MSTERRIEGEGTPESAWRASASLARCSTRPLDFFVPVGKRVVVVAPHPDDELLGCGGLLAMLARQDRAVRVIGVTDGEASHRGSRRWPPERLASARRTERNSGLERLGLPEVGVPAVSSSLALPDGDVAAHEGELEDALFDLLGPNDVVLTTWRLDGHPDHEATGRATLAAGARRGATCREMPVWMWHWARADDARVPWPRMHRLALDDDALARKRHAVAAHVTQLDPDPGGRGTPVLPDWALARVLRPFETFICGEQGNA